MGRRIGAAVIDGLVVFVPFIVFQTSQMESFEYSSSDEATDKCEDFNELHESGICVNAGETIYYSDDVGPAPLLLFGLAIAMFVVLQGLTGWTLGKLATGIRVVRATDGRVPGIGKAIVRWLLWIVDSLPIFWLVGIITAATSTGHRRVGDMAAGTLVVRADAAGRPIGAPGLSDPAATFGAPAGPSAYASTGMPAPTAKPGPQWDEARGTYIQWDPDLQAWVQWDDATKRWTAIAVAPAVPPPPTAAPPPPPPPPPPAPPA
jgi:hypothetical protein